MVSQVNSNVTFIFKLPEGLTLDEVVRNETIASEWGLTNKDEKEPDRSIADVALELRDLEVKDPLNGAYRYIRSVGQMPILKFTYEMVNQYFTAERILEIYRYAKGNYHHLGQALGFELNPEVVVKIKGLVGDPKQHKLVIDEAKQRILFERIQSMEVFPGTLEKFERVKGQPYEAIDVPRGEKFLFEESPGALPIRHSLRTLLRRDVYLEPRNLRSHAHPPGILEQAAKLGADAIVDYRVVSSYIPPSLFYSSPTINCKIGLPVKKRVVEVVTSH